MKKILTIILSFILLILPISGCKDKDDLKVIELNEVTHSVFYAPLYIAIENGYFEEEKLQVNLTNGGGADNSMTAVLSKTADIGLMGPETVIYVYNQNKADYPKVFGQLTQKDGSFLVSRIDDIKPGRRRIFLWFPHVPALIVIINNAKINITLIFKDRPRLARALRIRL